MLDVQIFLLCLSMDSCISKLGLFFLCTCVECWNGSRYTHGASNTKGLSILILKKEYGKLAHVFWAFSSVIKTSDVLFDEKSSSASLVYSLVQTHCGTK